MKLACCTPHLAAFPSGRTWAHADDCPRPGKARQKVRDDDQRAGRSVWHSPQPFEGLRREATLWQMRHGR